MLRTMVGGCCVCLDDRGWDENPLVYCDGHGCNVAVHQACYGIVKVPSGPWFCCKCQSTERIARVKCELCPLKDGALKRTDNGGWAHVVCALYIPEVKFGNVATMQPIILSSVPHERYMKTCYICEENGRESKTASGACMACNKPGCRHAFHVTCAQAKRMLCEEGGHNGNVQYVGYCSFHWAKKNKVTSDDDARTDPSKEKEKKPRHRNDSVSSISSDISSSSHGLDMSTGKRPKKLSSKNPIDVISALEEPHPSSSWHPESVIVRPEERRNTALPPGGGGVPRHDNMIPSPAMANGLTPPPPSYYPVNLSQFTMEDLLKRDNAINTVNASNGPNPSVNGSLQGGGLRAVPSVNAGQSVSKKRRASDTKKIDTQKVKKPKAVSAVDQTAKKEQVKKMKKKALKVQQTVKEQAPTTQDLSSLAGNEHRFKPLQKSELPKPSLLSVLENGDATSNWATTRRAFPESFQDLLEFQWNEGAQLLMQRALSFDVASLLTCLHELKSDNSKLESRLGELLRRRDRLLGVNARLTIPLGGDQSALSQHPVNPLSSLLSQLRGNPTADPFTNAAPPAPVSNGGCVSVGAASNVHQPALSTSNAKTEKKASRPKQPTKKAAEKAPPSSVKKSHKKKTAQPPPVATTTSIDPKSSPLALSKSVDAVMNPVLHHIVRKEQPMLPTAPSIVLAPKPQQHQPPSPFSVQAAAHVLSRRSPQPLPTPGNQRHSPSTYGTTQAALPQTSGALGFLVSHLQQHPFTMTHIVNGGNDSIQSSVKQDTARPILPLLPATVTSLNHTVITAVASGNDEMKPLTNG